jgi:predicted Zn-dependent protease
LLLLLWEMCFQCPALPIQFKERAIIRDVEIEDILKQLATPLLKKAGISPQSTQIYLVVSPGINALSMPGNFILLNTGLVEQCSSVDAFLFVLAHEIGHLHGQHILGRLDRLREGMGLGIAGFILGGALAIFTGRPDALMIGYVGQGLGQASFLSFSRDQEMAADLSAFRFLDQLGWSKSGGKALFQKMGKDSSGPKVYMRTHPLAQERLEVAKRHAPSKGKTPTELAALFKRLQEKVQAYMGPLHGVIDYSNGSPDLAAIRLYRKGQLHQAIEHLKSHKTKLNPYELIFYAELLFEDGQFDAAYQALTQATAQMSEPKSACLTLEARILIAKQKNLKEVIGKLERAALLENDNPEPWHFLAIAAGLLKQSVLVQQALAEKKLREGNLREALSHVERGLKLNPSSQARKHLEELRMFLQNQLGQSSKRTDTPWLS